jgi:repressor LexA
MLTGRQQSILEFIVDFRRRNGCSPSIPEIQRYFGIRSPNGVAGHLHALEAKGVIRRAERGSRQIDVVAGPGAAVETPGIPVYGQIAAGPPETVLGAKADGYLHIDEVALGFRPKEGCFALKVRGDSMKDAGILQGDTVVVEPTPSPRAGQVVVALIDGESTLKRLVRVKGKWFLKAENPAYPEIHPRADLVIQGVVRTVLRRLD